MKFNRKAFAKAIKDHQCKTSYVKRKHIGLRELGRQMKISSATLSRIMNGKKSDIDSILLICKSICKPITNFIVK